ncbi:hypothetical protein roselon_02064 [Roseibacterium elongatum DSM 19469]|uniref:Uncharacterized protein n=1 Tax=Roseicyclus elongatus DSM 19469 TaxID=1294273 RepID=W8SPJ0_9RHOB|nr:hypothetical protein [Roseibacterium elongatum]AHM04415.1 hypothetical protein roselon_02064 [Roseibacterium elongatum DSM 19469]
MERITKIVLSIVFPGIVGFFAACILVLPQLILRGMDFAQSLAVGVILSGLCAALCARCLRSRIQPAPVRDGQASAAMAAE